MCVSLHSQRLVGRGGSPHVVSNSHAHRVVACNEMLKMVNLQKHALFIASALS